MSSTTKDQYWLDLITQCRASGLTDRQWCIQNDIPVSTFYYHVRTLRSKACDVPDTVGSAVQKQEVIQIPVWENGPSASQHSTSFVPTIRLEIQDIQIEINEQAGAGVIRNTLLALQQLC